VPVSFKCVQCTTFSVAAPVSVDHKKHTAHGPIAVVVDLADMEKHRSRKVLV